MRGKLERADSKIRQMYLSQLAHKRAEKLKNSVSFAEMNSFGKHLDNIYERATRDGASPLHASKGSNNNVSLISVLSAVKLLKHKLHHGSHSKKGCGQP